MIEIRNLNKTFHTANGDIVALDDINLTIQDGEIFGIIGLSGAGKSTLVRCINLLEVPTSGQVLVDGKDLLTRTTPSATASKTRNSSAVTQALPPWNWKSRASRRMWLWWILPGRV